MRRIAIVCALLLVPFFPAAQAAGAEPRSWAPYNAVSEVVAIALAREGTAIAAALEPAVQAPAPPTGVPGLPSPTTPNVAATDLSILEFDTGFARNGTITAATPQGRTHVAVSRDGSSIASVGVDGPDPRSPTLRVQYQRVSPGTNWSAAVSAGSVFESSINLGGRDATVPVGLAISHDGTRVAVLTAEAGSYVLRGFAYSGTTFVSAFEQRAPGTPRALGASSDLSHFVVAGQFPVGNFTYGGAYLLPFSQVAEPFASHFDRAQNNTNVVTAAMSADGSVVALGGGDGRVHVFRGGSLATPASATVGGAPLGKLTLSEDGSRVAASIGLTLTALDATATPPTELWNASLTGVNVTELASNRTGGLLLAATSGTGGAVTAFSDADNAPLWSIPGDARAVAVDSAGTRIAYAQRAAISAARLPRLLLVDLVEGGKVAPQRTVTVPGEATFQVSLRNEGAAVERVVFEEGAPEFTIVADPVLVKPGTIVKTNFTVRVAPGLVAPRVFNVTARSISSGVLDNVTLSIAPKPTLDVKLSLNGTDVLAQPGQRSTLLLTIANNGTSDAEVALRGVQVVSAGPLWDLRVSETSFTVLRRTSASVRVEMTPPATTANGTSSTVTFTLEGQDIFDTATVTYRVNPELKVKVNATGVTKFIEPGKRASYNVTVTNIGTLPRQFEIFYAITETTGRSWGVDMASQTVRIEPEQKRVLPVTIIAPGDVQPNERVSVRVTARSIPEQVNESAVIDNVTLFGVAVPLKITTTTTTPNGIPFVAPAAVVSLAFLAILLRRRS